MNKPDTPARKAKQRMYQATYRARNLSKVRAAARVSNAKNAYRVAKSKLAEYGLTIDEFAAMVVAQEGKCAICSTTPKRLRVDHHHASGQVRNLLCHGCNAGLGAFKESPEALELAAAYLRRWGSDGTNYNPDQAYKKRTGRHGRKQIEFEFD